MVRDQNSPESNVERTAAEKSPHANTTDFIPGEQFAQTILNAMSAHIAILDEDGVILETNQAWKRFATANDPQAHPDAVKMNYLEICDTARGDSSEEARDIAKGIRAVMRGDQEEFVMDYPCHSPTEKRWFYLRATRIPGTGPHRIVISHENITPLKLAEEALRKHEQELEMQTQNLAEANTALKVLLKQREADRYELEQKVLANVKELVLPYVEKVSGARLKAQERRLMEIVETNLKQIISPFLQRLSAAHMLLTPQEIQVAALVKDGKASKEIAAALNISVTTVNFHRKNLRQKLGLKNTQTNLRTHLMSLAE